MASENDDIKSQDVVVVMVPLPAQGHLNQLLQLSRLVSSYNIPVHYVGASEHIRQVNLRVHGWEPLASTNIHFNGFDIPPYQTPLPQLDLSNRFPSHLLPSFVASSHLTKPVSELLRSLSLTSRRVIVIHDSLMASVVQEVSKISNAESYAFHSISSFTIFLYIWEQLENKPIERNNIMIPKGIPSLQGCFSAEFVNFMAEQYKFHEHISGKIYNTCRVIEGGYMDLLEKQTKGMKHWALGPFNPIKPENRNCKTRHPCLEWLDKQESSSVIYVSFGTTVSMSNQEIKELAIGLRKSKQKFIWVLRDADRGGDVLNGDADMKLAENLPIGYEESVKEKGLVVRNWAPQLEILAHRATGGFMSHCGWNSCIESITMGVPIAAWPMHSDQPRNTVLVTKVLKIGIVVKDWEKRDQIVTSDIIEASVKKLMDSKQGHEVRKRAEDLCSNVRGSLGEGGVSRGEFDSFIAHVTR